MSRPAPDAALFKKGVSRILPDDADKVAKIMELYKAANYRSHAQRLKDEWEEDDEEEEEDDVYRPVRRAQKPGLCRQCCRGGLCCCMQCSLGGFFCTLGTGLFFVILYYVGRYVVSLYKVQ